MAEFAYVARDESGRRTRGTVRAESRAYAFGKVRELGLRVERLRTRRFPPFSLSALLSEVVSPLHSGVSMGQLALFYRRLAGLYHAGVPLSEGLALLGRHTRRRRMREILGRMEEQARAGWPISSVMNEYPFVFTDMQREMVRAAECGGMLEGMLGKLSAYQERALEFQRKAIDLALHPLVLFLLAWFVLGGKYCLDGVPAIVKWFMAPAGLYTNADYLRDTAGLLVVFLGAALLGSFAVRVAASRSPRLADRMEMWKWETPVLGVVVRGFAVARFCYAFGAIYEAGIPVSAAVRMAGAASGSRFITRAAEYAARVAHEGMPVSKALGPTGLFGADVTEMLQTGEETGNVDALMAKAAEEAEHDATDIATVAMTVLAISLALSLAIAVIVGILNSTRRY